MIQRSKLPRLRGTTQTEFGSSASQALESAFPLDVSTLRPPGKDCRCSSRTKKGGRVLCIASGGLRDVAARHGGLAFVIGRGPLSVRQHALPPPSYAPSFTARADRAAEQRSAERQQLHPEQAPQPDG